jgi:type VI secretion system protein ImpA
MLDIARLLRPVDGSSPTGEDLSYAEIAELERQVESSSGAPTGEAGGGGWSRVEAQCLALFDRTKDLRLGVLLAHAAVVTRGLAGLGEALSALAGLLEAYWPTLHPRLWPEEGFDATERANVLSHLSPDADQSHSSTGAESFQRALRDAVLVDARGVGRFTLRDFELALSRGATSPGAGGPALVVLERARTQCEPGARRACTLGVQQALEALATIDAVFQRETGRGRRLVALQRTLERAHRFLGPFDAAGDVDAPVDPSPAPHGHDAFEHPPSMSPWGAATQIGPIATRDDAVRALTQVADFVRESQPSSPAPLFIERAAALLQMDFADIVRTLMPAARSHIELLGGVSLETAAR